MFWNADDPEPVVDIVDHHSGIVAHVEVLDHDYFRLHDRLGNRTLVSGMQDADPAAVTVGLNMMSIPEIGLMGRYGLYAIKPASR